MERFSKRAEDKITQENFEFIFQNALGNVIISESEPTLSTLKANTLAKYGNALYIKFANNTGLKISGTALT